MKLSIVIVNYNVKHFIYQCLSSVLRSKVSFDYEVFVVDNNSHDGSVKMIKEQFPLVHLIANQDNRGFSKANNQAIHMAKGEYVLLLNPDTICQEETLQKVVDFMDDHDDAGGLGVKMIDGKGNFLPESKRGIPSPAAAFYKMSGLSRLFPNSEKLGKYHLSYLDDNETHEIEVLSGAFMLLRKSLLDEIGVLDETFFMYGEDIDLSYRILKAGYKNYYYPETQIIHFKGESTRKDSFNYVRVFYKAMAIFTKKHYSNNEQKFSAFFLWSAIYLRASLAVLGRIFKAILFPLVDALLLFGTMFGVKVFWENVVKVSEGTTYSDLYLKVNAPMYIAIWLLFLFINGAYDRNYKKGNALRGMVIGTVVIAAVYGFLPMALRFSRGMILTSAVLGFLLLMFLRQTMKYIKVRPMRSGKTILVGDRRKFDEVSEFLQQLRHPKNIAGFVHDKDVASGDVQYLGGIDKLPELCIEHNVNEVMFSTDEISYDRIIPFMTTLGDHVSFKLIQDDGKSIIGSNSKNIQGELFAVDITFDILKPEKKRNKRLVDIMLSFMLIVVCPLYLLFIAKRVSFMKDLFHVISGRKTFVGYWNSEGAHVDDLPYLKDSLTSSVQVNFSKTPNDNIVHNQNLIYARDYTVRKDLEILIRYLAARKF